MAMVTLSRPWKAISGISKLPDGLVMKSGSSSGPNPDRVRVEGMIPSMPRGIARRTYSIFHPAWRGWMILVFQIVVISVWAQKNAGTNEVAYLGSQPGQRTLTPIPVPVPEPVTGTTNTEWLGGGLPWWQWSRLTGNWDQVRSKLETNGLTFAGRFTTDTSVGLSSGIHQRGIQRGLLDLNFTLDPEPLLGISGGTFFAQYYFRYGPHGSDDIGDLQGYDNLDAGRLNQAEEVWYEQKLVHDHLRFKAGQVDANAEFDNLPAAVGFINSSAGFSPTLLNFPTYPNPALSANLFVYPAEWLYCGAGVYADNLRALSAYRFQHPYLIGEAGLTHPGTGHFGPGRVAAGLWHDTAGVSRFDGGLQDGTSGYYVLAEQQAWKRQPGAADDERGVSLFAQFGSANPEVSPVAHHLGIGVSATGLMSKRDNDEMGIYWSWVELSRAAGSGFTHNEISLEGFYQCQITPFFALKPDLQWIRHPGGQSSPDAAWVTTLRVIIDF
jgi:porin